MPLWRSLGAESASPSGATPPWSPGPRRPSPRMRSDGRSAASRRSSSRWACRATSARSRRCAEAAGHAGAAPRGRQRRLDAAGRGAAADRDGTTRDRARRAAGGGPRGPRRASATRPRSRSRPTRASTAPRTHAGHRARRLPARDGEARQGRRHRTPPGAIAAELPVYLSSALDGPVGIAAAAHLAQVLRPAAPWAGLAHGLATQLLFADTIASVECDLRVTSFTCPGTGPRRRDRRRGAGASPDPAVSEADEIVELRDGHQGPDPADPHL